MAWVHALAKRFRIRELMNAGLARWPIRRTLPESGVTYRIETFETLAVERTYFGNPAFAQIFGAQPPGTFIDLGCNSGIFPCLLAHVTRGQAPRGLCVDANSQQVELARKTARINGWNDVHLFCGMVGSKNTAENEAEFFLAPTTLGSSQFPYQDTESGHPLDWKRIMVPTLLVEPTWTRIFGPDLPCNCLKVDIEGSEMSFLRNEAGFLSRVDTVLLEWHAFATSREEVVGLLREHRFELTRTIEDEPRHGVLYFRKH
jgi:FkbM family methyltransferase